MTALKQAVIRAVVAKWMADKVSSARTVLNAEALANMDVGDRKKAVLDDGTVIGAVTVTDPKWIPKIVNSNEFLKWVEENHPEHVEKVTRVHAMYAKALVNEVQMVDGAPVGRGPVDAFDPKTGEVVPGVAFTRGNPGITVPKLSEDNECAIEEALADGRLASYVGNVLSAQPPEELEE